MRIVNVILLKIWEKLKNKCFTSFWILKTNLLKIRDKLMEIMYIVENMRLINDKIRNLKNEKILNFLIDPLIESGPDDPALIASELRPGRPG